MPHSARGVSHLRYIHAFGQPAVQFDFRERSLWLPCSAMLTEMPPENLNAGMQNVMYDARYF
jgi:hypothetical protein